MIRKLRLLAAFVSVVGLGMPGATAFAAPKDKQKDQQKDQQKNQKDKPGGAKQAKAHKSKNGKNLLGEKLKKNGRHKLEDHGKHSAFADVDGGKIKDVKVSTTDGANVPVTKYKSNTKMAANRSSRYQLATLAPAQEYVDTVWIGFAYIDEWGDEIIYWFPYDMVYDPYTGAIDYYPA